MKVAVITDNNSLYQRFRELISRLDLSGIFQFYYSRGNVEFEMLYQDNPLISAIELKEQAYTELFHMDLIISLHCRQIFPADLVGAVRCINIHPGYNPYNRGWYPHIFSLVKGGIAGVTIHEMDEKIDHGPIIYREEVQIEAYDTSYEIYCKIQDLEIAILEQHILDIINNDYETFVETTKGNMNYKEDFRNLCRLNLKQQGTFEEFLNILRATTFQGYNNAYYTDEQGNRIYVSIQLKKEEDT